MKYLKLAAFCMFASCAAIPATAQGTNQCASTEQVMQTVKDQGYQLSFIGEVDGLGGMVIVTGPKGWIAMATGNDGVMCVFANGTDWELKQSGEES